jgi:hypothetical protein
MHPSGNHGIRLMNRATYLVGVSGTLAGLTFVQTRRGTVHRVAPRKGRPSPPAMQVAQERMRLASMAFGRPTRA